MENLSQSVLRAVKNYIMQYREPQKSISCFTESLEKLYHVVLRAAENLCHVVLRAVEKLNHLVLKAVKKLFHRVLRAVKNLP